MVDKRTIVFPSLLFVIFLILITLTGFFQIRIIHSNIERQLAGEAEIVFSHVKREIDINLEYLSLLDKSPTIITPYFFNVMAFDEAIIEDLDNIIGQIEKDLEQTDLSKLSFASIFEYDTTGKIVSKKGGGNISPEIVRKLLYGEQETVIRIPTQKDRGLLFGKRIRDRIFFLRIEPGELETYRRKTVLKDIVEREGKRLNVAAVRIFDGAGVQIVGTGDQKPGAFVLSRPLGSRFLPGFRMDIFVSRDLAQDTIQRTGLSFILILSVLFLLGGGSIYAFFVMERKYAKKVKDMEREMEIKERLVSLGKLASGMAHEIRNPLNAISLSVQRLKREFIPSEEKKGEYFTFLDIIRKELTRVNNIVEEFLQSTRAQAPFNTENLREIIEEVIIIVGERAVSKGIFIENTTGPDINIECQKDRIKQAFYNIIINGIESMEDGGRIEITTKRKDASVETSVRDSGGGIDEGSLARVFEYYYTTKDKGMGLGLPISYMIVKDHGGDIKVAAADGQGTVFTIVLPLKQGKTDSQEKNRQGS